MSKRIASLHADIGVKISNAKSSLNKFKGDLKDSATQAKKTKQSFDDFKNGVGAATGIIVGFGAALYGAWEGLKAGAELELVEMRFDRLSESIGTTGDALERDLSRATRGMYSDAEQMALATELMSLGLAKSHDEAVRLTAVASALNMNMNQLVLTLTNRTTMRFDALGVAVDGFDEKVDQLKKTGMSTNDAFQEAFLQQAEAQIERVGHAADTTAGKMQKFEADMKNVSDGLKKQFAEAISPSISGWSKFFDAQDRARIATVNATKAGLAQNEVMEIGRVIMNGGYSEWQDYSVALDTATRGYMAMTPVVRENTEVLDENAVAAMFTAENAGLILSSGMSLHSMTERYNEQLTALNEKLGEESEALLALEERYGVGTEKTEEQRAKVSELEGQIDSLNGKMNEQTARWVLNMMQQRGATDELQLSYATYAGLITEKEAEITSALLGNVDNLNSLAEQYGAAGITAEDWAGLTVGGLGAVSDAAGSVAGGAENIGLATQTATDTMEANAPIMNKAIGSVTDSFGEGVEVVHGYNIGLTRLIRKIEKLDGMSATATINIVVNGGVPNIGSSSSSNVYVPPGHTSAIPGGSGFASGVSDFIVPSGFPNDSFMVGLTSGERVNVETKAQQRANNNATVSSNAQGGIDYDRLASSLSYVIGDAVADAMQRTGVI